MAYLGLNNLPAYNPSTSFMGGYQTMQNFLTNQAQQKALTAGQNITNQYAPQVNQANIANTQATAALNQAQATSPNINPQANYQAMYNAYMNTTNPQEKAGYAALLNKSVISPPNYMGMPGMTANGPFSTNPNTYGGQPVAAPQGGPPQAQPPMTAPQQGQPMSAPPPNGQMPMNSPQGNVTGSNYNPNFATGNPGGMPALPPPVNPNQAPLATAYNMMTSSRAPKQKVLDNGDTSTIVSAPTTTAQSQAQIRDSARAELTSMAPTVTSSPYQGNIFQRYGAPASDLGSYFLNYLSGTPQPQDLVNRMVHGYLAGNLLPAVGGSGARVDLASNAGEKAQQKSSDAYGRALPDPDSFLFKDLFPAAITAKAGPDLTSSIQNSGDAANKEAAIGSPVQVATSQVADLGGNPTPYQQQPLSFQGGSPQSSQGSQALPPMPTFKNENEFNSWYLGLPPDQRQAYKAKLSGGNK